MQTNILPNHVPSRKTQTTALYEDNEHKQLLTVRVVPDGVATRRSVPVVITGRPRQAGSQRTEQVVQSQRYDHVVINAYKTVEYTVTQTHTYTEQMIADTAT